MKRSFLAKILIGVAGAILCVIASAQPPAAGQGAPPTQSASANGKLYNTAKQKLLDKKQVFSFTQTRADPADYCEKAKHYDYAWFELQHSTLEFRDVEAMIAACPKAAAIPMIRLPDAQEWHIQHSTDIGALGVIIPTVDDVERALEAAKWSRFPPVARRSSGGGQAGRIWGGTYRQTFNDNMLVVVMIETPTGVANAYDIARVPGVDVVIIGNNDLASFTGWQQSDPRYQAMVTKVHDDTVRAGKIFGQANASYAKGHPLSNDSWFFQNGPSNDGWTPAGPGGRGGNVNAPPEGEEEGLGGGAGQAKGKGKGKQ